MKATRLPSASDSLWKCGNSARQGPHHEAHWFTTTGCPRSDRSRALKAAGPPPTSWQLRSYREASGAGAPASGAGTLPQLPPALFPWPPPPPPAWERPMTSAATRATAPAARAIRFTMDRLADPNLVDVSVWVL